MMNCCLNRRFGKKPGIRHDAHGPAGCDDPVYFTVEARMIEPVKCLRHRHQINRARRQCGPLRQTGNVRQPVPSLGGPELRHARIGSYHMLKVGQQERRGLAVPGGAIPGGASLGR